MTLIFSVIIFGLIVTFHEFGHFLLAKSNGIVVTEFAIGMGPTLARFGKGETVYAIKLLPIGGSCMMLGEDAAMEEADNLPDGEVLEGSFNSKSVWARISVILAGPIFNFMLAFFCALIIVGNIGYAKPQITQIVDASPAQAAGLQPGDTIVKVNKTNIHTYDEFRWYLYFNQGERLQVTIDREGTTQEITLTPKLEDDGMYRVGIYGGEAVRTDFADTLKYGFYEMKSSVTNVINSLGMLVTGKIAVTELAGPVGVVEVVGDSYEQARPYGFMSVLLTMCNLVMLLSANLGVMNLLPIPALDGGRFVFLLIEAVRGKPISREKEGFIHFVGFAALMVLMVFVLFNDIGRIMAG